MLSCKNIISKNFKNTSKIISQLYDFLFYKNVVFMKVNVEVWNTLFFKSFKDMNLIIKVFYCKIL